MSELTSMASMPATFKDALRDRVLKSTLDLMPPDLLGEYIDREIKAFFDTEQLLTVAPTKVVVDNPSYDSNKGYNSYSNEKQLSKETLAFGSKMTPFRQMVWGVLFEHLRPRMVKIVDDETSAVRVELDKWIAETSVPVIGATNKTMFNSLASTMASTMFHNAISQSVSHANMNIRSAMASMGANPSQLPQLFQP